MQQQQAEQTVQQTKGNFFLKVNKDGTEELKVFRIFGSIVAFCAVYGAVMIRWGGNEEFRGTFGDMFGAVNTLFSGLAFAGIIYTIFQQRAEFSLQRKELELQRKEVAKTNEALDEQVKTANIQRFENTFFQLTSMHQEIVNNLDTGNQNDKKGRLYITSLYKRVKNSATKDPSGKIILTSAKEKLEMILDKEGLTALSYYAHILNVIKFVQDSSVLSIEEKSRYMEFYKTLITLDELKTIYLFHVDNGEVMKLFEDSDFLKSDAIHKIFTDEVNIYA